MFTRIGRTLKAHGIKGELKLFIEPGYWEDFLKNERFFVDVNGAKVPYFITDVRSGNDIIVQLEDVPDRDAAIVLQGRDLYLRDSDLIPAASRERADVGGAVYASVEGYTLVDAVEGELGVIQRIRELPNQEMAVVAYRGREVLVPLNAHFVQRIDAAGKKVHVELPEGLLEL